MKETYGHAKDAAGAKIGKNVEGVRLYKLVAVCSGCIIST